jgi:flagellar basal-body rod modification protein FlgD
MNTIASAGTTSSTAGQTGAGAGGTVASNMLGKDDFLKLLVGQLRQQDPMNPTSDKDFLGQMAQFAMVEQLTQIAQTGASTAAGEQRSSAIGLIGRTVSYVDASGATQQGVVERVNVTDALATLTVGGVDGIDPAGVREVK